MFDIVTGECLAWTCELWLPSAGYLGSYEQQLHIKLCPQIWMTV